MLYSPLVDMLEKAVKEMFKWFFVNWLFTTRETQNEVRLFFDTGKTKFRHLEWLNIGRLKSTYPARWKYILADFAGAYLKLLLLGALVSLFGIRFLAA